MEYRKATLEDLDKIWDKDIEKNPNDAKWKRWKNEYINYNLQNEIATFVAVDDGNPIGQISVVFSPKVKAVAGKSLLCNGKNVANFNAFRIDKKYEGQGHISKLVEIAQEYAKNQGINFLTIGSEARETRNLAIYLHFGFTKFLMYEFDEEEEEKPLVLYFGKDI